MAIIEYGKDQESTQYIRDNFVFLPRQLKRSVEQSLSSNTLSADVIYNWLRWGKQTRTNLDELKANNILITIVQEQYPALRSVSNNDVAILANNISNAWGNVQTTLFNIYPRSGNGYLESYLWESANSEPVPRSQGIPAQIRTVLQGFVDSFTVNTA